MFQAGETLFNNSIEEARQKASGQDLTAAIRILLAAADSPTIQLKSHRQQLLEQVKRYRERKAEQKADVEDRLQKAKLQFEKESVSAALDLLLAIPEPVRTAEVEQLISEIENRKNESKRLTSEITQLVKKNDLTAALPKIRSLQELRPHDEKLSQLATNSVRRIMAAAEKLKKSFSYEKAYSLVKAVENAGFTAKPAEVKREIEEIIWLSNYVKKILVTDQALVQCVTRLAELAPTESNQKLIQQAKKRLQTQQVQWAIEPKRRVFDLEIQRSTEAGIVNGLDTVNCDGYRSECFQVAAGLAIQGLGLGPISAELMEKRTTFFGFGGKRKAQSAWGIDFGPAGVKFIKLAVDPEQKIKLEQVDRVGFRATDSVLSFSELRSRMSEALIQWKTKYEVRKDEVIVANLNPNQVLARYVKLPASDDKALKAALEYEVKLQVPFPLDEVIWDSHNFSAVTKGKRLSFVVAARKQDVNQLQEMFKAHGLKLAGIQPESVALYNFTRLSSSESDADHCEVILDLGSTSSTLTVVSPSQIWLRTFGVGTHHFVRSVAKQLRINQEQAEKILLNLKESGAELVPALRALDGAYTDLVTEIARSLRAHQSDMGEVIPAQIKVVGGGARLQGLTSYLSHGPEAFQVT